VIFDFGFWIEKARQVRARRSVLLCAPLVYDHKTKNSDVSPPPWSAGWLGNIGEGRGRIVELFNALVDFTFDSLGEPARERPGVGMYCHIYRVALDIVEHTKAVHVSNGLGNLLTRENEYSPVGRPLPS